MMISSYRVNSFNFIMGLIFICYSRSLGVVVCVAISCMVDGPGFESRQEQALFLFFKIVRTCFCVHPASCSMGTGFFPTCSAVGPCSEYSGLLAYDIVALGEWLLTCLRNQGLYVRGQSVEEEGTAFLLNVVSSVLLGHFSCDLYLDVV